MININPQEDQNVIITEKIKGTLSQENRIALDAALKKGELSNIHDILSLLGYSNSDQA